MKQLKAVVLISLILFLGACSKWGRDDDDNGPYKGMSAKQLFDQSKDAIAKGQYQTASKRLEALESMYPFSEYAEQAQLDLIYAYYQNGDYASTAATADRFIHLYPRAQHVDYAYYMKGLANFNQPRGSFANVIPLDESMRDAGTQAQAYSDFAALIERFPNSRYKPNALQRMIYLRNTFAQRELNASKYFFERKKYVAAAERASYLVKNYPQAPAAQPGLVLLYKSNLALGLTKAAADALAVYNATYPNQPLNDSALS
ncbi:outer membrane protein assembly factor BamD [Legionella sp. MW5194]|uniref:outer membrane protein assembly factor BamD n=1 Tax=Legionella sp. MW5194 TaxID=2662448 RepID=UPI00193D4E10|nr:outer membrane protein assembly factor BamD [Legionella sp. MW5194]QRN03632.1 outer membrane protein assembly factor BamD [Legionella sp. MW5194]